jgi:hypothetical protein
LVRTWADFVKQSNRLVDSQQPWQKAMVATIPAAQRSIQASVEMIDRTSRSGIAWMKTALDSAAAPKAILAAGTRAQELVERSANVIETGVRAIADAHREAADAWEVAMRNGSGVEKSAARGVGKHRSAIA